MDIIPNAGDSPLGPICSGLSKLWSGGAIDSGNDDRPVSGGDGRAEEGLDGNGYEAVCGFVLRLGEVLASW